MRWSDFAPAAMDAYRAAWREPGAIEAMCEDYRAGMFVDAVLDRADRDAGRRIAAPLLTLWGGRGPMVGWFDMLDIWRPYAEHVDGQAVDATHFLVEDRPDEVGQLLHRFFAH